MSSGVRERSDSESARPRVIHNSKILQDQRRWVPWVYTHACYLARPPRKRFVLYSTIFRFNDKLSVLSTNRSGCLSNLPSPAFHCSVLCRA